MSARLRWMLISVVCAGLLAGATAWLVTDWALHRHAEHHTHDGDEPDLHEWMHAHLDLTPEQHAAMEPGETAFATLRTRLKAEIHLASQALATLIPEADEKDPRLNAALERLSRAQAALQRATLDHFYAMKRYLRPAQQRELLTWTHDSLARH